MDCDQAKLFVGGIPFDTTEETLKDHFSKYGEVVETVIVKDKNSGNTRGFGFVLFSDPSFADEALQDKHVLLSRTVEVKKALPRGGKHQNYQQHSKGFSKNNNNIGSRQFSTKKIFVGGLSASVTEEDFKSYFEVFGTITDVVVMFDNVTHRPRGFGFITFDSEQAVENVMARELHVLNNKSVEVKRAVPKDGPGAFIGNSYNYSNNHNAGRVSIIGRYGVFPPFDPRFNVYSGYAPSPVSGYPYGAYGGYPIGGYGGVGVRTAPMTVWNGSGLLVSRRSPLPYGNGPILPGYMNGGVGGYTSMGTGDYHGIMGTSTNGKMGQDSSYDSELVAGVSLLNLDAGKSDDDSSSNLGSYANVVGRQNQTGSDGQLSPCTVGNSS
ncbi:heterogeneous nuclear ribonucleoprotein 1-like [Thalictrum thalictroides]|uniref:Heterogeneous nuclear ribonucleoprotein 1-like n=1 Tax=Thalictrum thalictroides TaxID=46969 RepID=A0A7J6WSV5_THATH|nr:heterogeneous nuclear ribonucleoprotein 1-like [Thalictrum thalictroides]